MLVKVYRLPFIRINSGNLICSMKTVVKHTVVYLKVVKRIDLKYSYHNNNKIS